jgi:hypothetical protein
MLYAGALAAGAIAGQHPLLFAVAVVGVAVALVARRRARVA